MENFGEVFNCKYLVVVNGNIVKKAFVNKKPAMRWCERYSVNKKNYVELWYQHEDGSTSLCDFWN